MKLPQDYYEKIYKIEKALKKDVSNTETEYNEYKALYDAAVATSSTSDDKSLAIRGMDTHNFAAVLDVYNEIDLTGEIAFNHTKYSEYALATNA